MSYTSLGLIAQIIGSVLLSSHIFKSPQEENDEAASWWDGNPFTKYSQGRKYVGFGGLLLLIFGFTLQLADNLDLAPNQNILKLLSSLAMLFLGIILVIAVYNISKVRYKDRRNKHFAAIASNQIESFKKNNMNVVQLFNSLNSHIKDLPSDFTRKINHLWSANQASENKTFIVKKVDDFESRLNELINYLANFK